MAALVSIPEESALGAAREGLARALATALSLGLSRADLCALLDELVVEEGEGHE